MMRVGCSGLAPANTGIGVLQRQLYPRLSAAGIKLEISEVSAAGESGRSRLLALWTRLRPPRRGVDAYLSVCPPLPLAVSAPTVAIVHDLRWQRTRSQLGKTYRSADLRRTVRVCRELICISERTAEDLAEFVGPVRVGTLALGPGQVDTGAFDRKREPGRVLLMGGAPHKRNELAARAFAIQRPLWATSVTGLNLSEAARDDLERAFGRQACRWFENVAHNEITTLYAEADVFVSLGVEEGFGMPYLEALASGCQVVAIDQRVTRVVLGPAGNLLFDGDAEELAAQLASIHSIDAAVREAQLTHFSWDSFAEGVIEALQRAVSDDGAGVTSC